MDFTQEQMEHAMKLTMEDLMKIGYRLDALSDVTAYRCDDVINGDIDTLSNTIAKQIVDGEMNAKTVERIGRIVTRLHDRLDCIYNDTSAVHITNEIKDIIKGDA